MAQATDCITARSLSVQAAAAELHSLINTRPTLPHVGEIEAIIAKAAVPSMQSSGIAVHHDKWLGLVQRWSVALRAQDVPEADPQRDALVAAHDQVYDELEALEKQIWESSIDEAHSFADIRLLADLLTQQCWPGLTLTGGAATSAESETYGTTRRDNHRAIFAGPDCQGDACNIALATLLKAIRDVKL